MNRDLFRRLYLPALPIAIAIAAFVPLTAAQQAASSVWEPDILADGAPLLEGTTWVGEAPGWAMWLKQLDSDERVKYIAGQTGLSIDPFATRPDEPPTHLSFLIVVENRSDEGIVFNPMNSWLKTSRQEIKTPIGLSDLDFDYRTTGRQMPPAYRKVDPTLLVMPMTIPAGEKVSGMLVYRMIKPKSKTYEVAVQVVLPSGDLSTFSAPYRRVKTKK